MDTFSDLRSLFGSRLLQNESLARYTTFKIGGPADYFFDAKTTDEFVSAIQKAREINVPVFVLGGGTNLLIGDRGVRGLVIKNSTNEIRIVGVKGSRVGDKDAGFVYIEAQSGVSMNKLVRDSVDDGYGGLEMQLGLPGTVGGAVYMNSKWTHPVGYVGDVVYQATILTPENNIQTVPKSYFQFGYDTSVLQSSRDIVLSVVFELTKGVKDDLWKVANESVAYRRATQPQGVNSAGCTFQNISQSIALSLPTPDYTTSAGYLIDHAGLKGKRNGNAQISTQHANFIINLGGAKASDVIPLIEETKSAVYAKFGVKLEEEIRRVGEF
jgi:UDP-N-acetylenolpyruvoylglucosamine reductase